MNNDIPRDIASYSKVQQVPTGRIELSKTTKTLPYGENEVDSDAMYCLGIMGRAQVNSRKNPVEKYIEEYMADPFKAKAEIEFCDNLMRDRDYDVWKAMNITNAFFDTLKEEKTYRE